MNLLTVVAHLALSHVSITSGPATANVSQEVSFGVGHGCNADDTYTIKIQIPTGVTSVRPMPNSFGKATVEKDGVTGNVTTVTYQKADPDLLPGDQQFYRLVVRLKPPNAPFTKVFFAVTQTCKSATTGALTVVEWKETTPHNPDAGTMDEPAAELLLLPARKAGWNRYTLSVAVAAADLPFFFGDATILWRGSEAYSTNVNTAAQIAATSGVSKLAGGLAASQEIWVKY